MMKSEQERKDWYRQELRFRRDEDQIGMRWFWVTQLAVCLVLLGTFARPLGPWIIGLTAVAAAFWSALAARAWALWFQHRRARRNAAKVTPEPPVG